MGLLRIEVDGFVCAPPNLVSATNNPSNSYENFDLDWNYGFTYYSSDSETSVSLQYSLDGGETWNNYMGDVFGLTDTSASITIPSITWEFIHFRLHLLNRSCSEYSNVIIIEYLAA